METLIFTKVHEERNKVYFELSRFIKEAPYEGFNFEVELEYYFEHTKTNGDEFLNEKGFRMICISDAWDHTGRMVFWATKKNGRYIPICRMNQLDGKHTNMYFETENNYRSIKPHEFYLRRIAAANGMGFKIIDKVNNE